MRSHPWRVIVVVQVLPDFKQLPSVSGATGNPELAFDKEWWNSVLRRFLGGQSGGQNHRPKQNRLATYWWLLALNSLLFRCVGHGLEKYRTRCSPAMLGHEGEGLPAQTPGQLQPYLALNIDQCSVGWSAVFS